jgi:hypothetical protein
VHCRQDKKKEQIRVYRERERERERVFSTSHLKIPQRKSENQHRLLHGKKKAKRREE